MAPPHGSGSSVLDGRRGLTPSEQLADLKSKREEHQWAVAQGRGTCSPFEPFLPEDGKQLGIGVVGGYYSPIAVNEEDFSDDFSGNDGYDSEEMWYALEDSVLVDVSIQSLSLSCVESDGYETSFVVESEDGESGSEDGSEEVGSPCSDLDFC